MVKIVKLEANLEKIASGALVPEREPSTYSGRYVFTVKEAADGSPWIALEAAGDELPVLVSGLLGLRLRKMDFDLARHVANVLNEYVEAVTYTG